MALVCWTDACVRANVIALGYCQRSPLSRFMANILAEREGERQRHRDRKRDRQTDRQTDRDRELFIRESKAHNYAFQVTSSPYPNKVPF